MEGYKTTQQHEFGEKQQNSIWNLGRWRITTQGNLVKHINYQGCKRESVMG
jgi:hypothetical protein